MDARFVTQLGRCTHYTREHEVRSICGGTWASDSDDITRVTCPACIDRLLSRLGPWPDTEQRAELERTRKAMIVEMSLS